MDYKNNVYVEMDSISSNESFARLLVAGFITPIDPTLSVLNEVKTAVSEAITNAIIHGYENKQGKIKLQLIFENKTLTVIISDEGCGIPDIEKARESLYTTKPEQERSGLGFTVMEAFMDSLIIDSTLSVGTTVTLTKSFN